jgi:hypothetical protein
MPKSRYRFPCLLAHIPTDISEIKYLSILPIRLRLLTLGISPFNIQLLKGKVVPATGRGRARRLGHFTFGRQIPPVLQ